MASMAVSVVLLAGDEDHRTAGVQLAEPAQHVQTGHVRQMDVEDDDIGMSLAGDLQCPERPSRR